MTQFVDKGLLLAGDVYLAEIVNGVRGPLVGPINFTEITVTPPTTEEKNRLSNKKSNFGQALDSVQLPKDPAKVGIKWDTMTKKLLADAIAGTGASFTIAESSVTDEAITLTDEGWVQLANDGISAVTVNLAAGGTLLVEGTDYEVNTAMGMLKAVSEQAKAAVLVDYTIDAKNGFKVSGATETLKPRYLLLDGENLAQPGQKVKVEIYQAMLSAQGSAALLSGEFMEGELEGSLVTPAGKSEPYTVTTYD